MRAILLILAAAGAVWAQSGGTTTYSTDLNGNRVAEASTTSTSKPGETTETQLSQSLNGREVPLQQTETRVLKSDASGTTTETIVRKYNPEGQLISTDRTVTETRNQPGGGSVANSTSYHTDVNGTEQPSEQRTVETQVQGSTTTTNTTVERPTLNGGFAPTEKTTSVTQTTADKAETTESVYRPNENGEFYEAVRRTQDTVKSGNKTTENAAEYERGATGDLQLHDQKVTTTTEQAGGRTTTEVQLFSTNVPGTVRAAGAAPELSEEQTITRRPQADGSVVETTSVRRPTINDPQRLGNPQTISETVCRGNCDDSAAAPAPSPAPAKP